MWKRNFRSPTPTVNCALCGKLVTKYLLEAHMRTHTGERPYKCETCKKSFKTKFARNDHVKCVHMKYKTACCIFCDKKFPNVSKLHNHIRAHIGEKWYDCKVCRKEFGTSYGRDRHQENHANPKRFKCVFCGEGFNFLKGLDNHIIKHHIRENPHSCERCFEDFEKAVELREHRCCK